jgi:pilus assembly protein TadC
MTLLVAGLVAAAVGLGVSSSRPRLLPRPRVRRRLRHPAGGRSPEPNHPLTIDLFAGCLAAGVAVPAALRTASAAASADVDDLLAVARAVEAGVEPATAWKSLLVHRDLADVARTCMRAAVSGAAVSDELHRVARRSRARRAVAARRRVQRASIWVVLPLGLCFLPAFVLVGVVPLVAASVPHLLG